MERGARIASMALAKTILSLNQAYRADGIWSASRSYFRLDQILWRYDWYDIMRFLVKSAGFQMAYLLGMDHITFYPGFQLMRQMGHTQGLPPAGALFEDTLISPRITVVVLG
ncbi:hypothetical protein JCGZ_27043 [Jatropha curcas]|uniref:Uncharacterized protein n=1 Tax=Jatropha curcas TaxID=180498 RepID=A0A067JVJ7_JATCU|nr:hypothetical protein JCGZ_27043 [Jatropha curcas]